uniref:Photolyase/cryptochrome alpha/beta domain-containing protein n=1 Tax=Megaselia scalaris TaxID=36166 RepID=T1GZF7_MEGSC
MEKHVNILWFRHGLRIHDNPALIESISEENVLLLPIFTFDGESAGTKTVGFNRMKFLLDSLNDLDAYFKAIGGKLHLIEGQPEKVFSTLNNYFKINKITFEQDCEPIWETRDSKVKGLNIPFVEKVSHTLWDPDEIITTNGGIPPLTYEMFLHTVQILGLPPRPVDEPKWDGVSFPELPKEFLDEFHVFDEIPTPEHFNLFPSSFKYLDGAQWKGGEVQAMVNLKKRLEKEEYAF